MTTSDSVRPLTAAEEADLRNGVGPEWSVDTLRDRLLATLDEARAGSLDAARLLDYLWNTADVEYPHGVEKRIRPKVRDLFPAEDPLAEDIDRALAAALREAQR